MTFTAGGDARAPEIRDALYRGCVATSDGALASVIANTDVPGIGLALESNSTYMFEAFIAYTSAAAPEINLTFTGPPGSTGRWGAYGTDSAGTGSVAGINALRYSSYDGGTNILTLGGSGSFGGALMCLPHGGITTAGASGALRLQFAQSVTTASTTAVNAGSWLRILKVS